VIPEHVGTTPRTRSEFRVVGCMGKRLTTEKNQWSQSKRTSRRWMIGLVVGIEKTEKTFRKRKEVAEFLSVG
jgi:hypothetical protein